METMRRQISEAPKDGTEILALVSDKWRILRWFESNRRQGWLLAGTSPSDDYFLCPTEWMPLPESRF